MATKEQQKEKIMDMLGNHSTAMLVTHDQQKGLVSRPMTTQTPDSDQDTVWFFVSSDSDVLDEIRANAEVNIAYTNEGDYLSISGAASIVTDDDKIKDLWYPELAKWFDGNGPESDDVRLIKVEIDTARYWDTSDDGPPQEDIVDYES